ncbi:TrbG/VirB9 family P-type conjugative transfer protein [Aeromonas salmonicida]|uniref:TrbG/VirB9 family P-type conjugative transfer protein n=1 Tax=Aeromonas salmonicida TaxID=645 RepID=UPI003D08B0FD
MKGRIISLILMVLSYPSFALVDPASSQYDSRVKTVTYNQDDVYRIDSVIGVGTSIILEPGEEYVTHTFGDSDAWGIKNKGNYYTIKPKAENGDTNLFLATNKRTYLFDIRYHDIQYPAGRGKASFDRRMTFVIKFRYPDVEAKKNKELVAKNKVKSALEILDKSNVNLEYSRNGDSTIAPINVWDNGVFTYFKFSPGQIVPVIFAVDPQGTERRVNFTACVKECSGNVVVAHSISNTWYLRRNNVVAGIYRGKFQGARESLTGTSTPKVQRVIKQ